MQTAVEGVAGASAKKVGAQEERQMGLEFGV